MRKIRGRIAVILLLVIALVTSGLVWAQSTSNMDMAVQAGGVGGAIAEVKKASASTLFLRFGDYKSGEPLYATPDWLRRNGTVQDLSNPGDIFFIDTVGNPSDIKVNIHMTNADELAHNYNNIFMRLNVYRLASVTNQVIGTGDGVEKHFYIASLPVIPDSETVYVNAVGQTKGVNYTIDYKKGKVKFEDLSIPVISTNITITYQYWTQATWLGSSVTISNEAVGTGDGNKKNFHLDHNRVIPDSETIYVDDIIQHRSKSADYIMDYDKGGIKFNDSAKPAIGAAITASYKYYTEAAFKGDTTLIRYEAVGTGNGQLKKFDLLHTAIVSKSERIYINGIRMKRDNDYTISYEHGDIKFNTAPDSDDAITAYYRYWTVEGTGAHNKYPGKVLAETLGYVSFLLEGNTKYDIAVVDAHFRGHKKGYKGGTDSPDFYIDVRAGGG